MASNKQEEFEKMGGTAMIEKISKIFYDKVYEDPWLKLYFQDVPQEHIERQQVAFMQAALGGENLYCGQTPPAAHKHMNITHALFEARQELLDEAFEESNTSELMIEKWQRIDDAFFNRIVKHAPEQCEKRYKTDKILDFPDPRKKR
jgi:hemoglobin